MKRTITVVYDGEVLRPLEPVDLEPNTCYLLTVDEALVADEPQIPQAVTRILERATDLGLPADLAAQHDHYLHGTPKR
jgi:predicted DNA-binding antitoxin AbrB/MazE fold protein